jgi:hypothetical protein
VFSENNLKAFLEDINDKVLMISTDDNYIPDIFQLEKHLMTAHFENNGLRRYGVPIYDIALYFCLTGNTTFVQEMYNKSSRLPSKSKDKISEDNLKKIAKNYAQKIAALDSKGSIVYLLESEKIYINRSKSKYYDSEFSFFRYFMALDKRKKRDLILKDIDQVNKNRMRFILRIYLYYLLINPKPKLIYGSKKLIDYFYNKTIKKFSDRSVLKRIFKELSKNDLTF